MKQKVCQTQQNQIVLGWLQRLINDHSDKLLKIKAL